MKKILTSFSFALLIIFLPLIGIQAYTSKDGGLVKGPNSTAVYYTINGGRYAFPTQKTFELYFGNNFWKVELINADELANLPLKGTVLLPDNTLIKIQSIPKVYKIITTGGIKTLEWIATEQDAINQFGNDWAKSVIDVSDAYFPDYQSNKLAIEMKDYYGSLENTTNTTSNTSTTSNNNTNATVTCPANYILVNNACVSYDTKCQNSYGSNSIFTGEFNSTGNFICGCKSDYTWNSDKTACITKNDYCSTKFGINSYSTGGSCECKDGYMFYTANSSCISSDQYCKLTYGADYYYKADGNICSTTATNTQTNTTASSVCDQMWAQYQEYSSGVQYSDPIYFSARESLKNYLSQYCGTSSTPTGNTSLPIAMGGVTSNIINGTTYYNFGNGLTGTRDTINGTTYYKYNNGLTGTQSTINGTTSYNFSNGLSGTSNIINGIIYYSFSNGLSGTSNTINGTIYYKYSNGTNYSCGIIGSTMYCN